MSIMHKAGYAKISKVEVEYWRDEFDRPVDAVVWLITKDGIFARTAKNGETEQEIAAYYRKRGYTDSNAAFIG